MLSEERKKNSDDSGKKSEKLSGEIIQTPVVKKSQFSSIEPERISSEEIIVENFKLEKLNIDEQHQISQFLNKFMFLRTSYEGSTVSVKICRKKLENEENDGIKDFSSKSLVSNTKKVTY